MGDGGSRGGSNRDGAVCVQEAKPSGAEGFLEGRTCRCPPVPAWDVSALFPRAGTGSDAGQGSLGLQRGPQSGVMVIRLLGDALGSPPPGKLQLLPGIIIAWIITRFRACWRILGRCQSREAGFRDGGRLPLLRAESKRKRVTIRLPRIPTWQGQDLADIKPREVGSQ